MSKKVEEEEEEEELLPHWPVILAIGRLERVLKDAADD
jgi:hypothetical protein